MKRLLSWIRVLGLWCLALVVVVHLTPVVPWYARWLAGDWTDSPGDVLIVLSSELERDGVLGYTSYLRCLYAIRAWRERPFSKVIVSGGRVANAPCSLAAAMRDFLAAYGVSHEALLVEEKSLSTRENALYTAELLRNNRSRKVLLTSDYHMFRARHAFARAGVAVTPRPFPDVLKRCSHIRERWSCFWLLLLETVKIAY